MPAMADESGDITKVQTQTSEDNRLEYRRVTGTRFHLQPGRTSSSSLEAEVSTTPTSSQQASLSQPAPPFFTPELSLRRANGIQTQLSYDSPVQGGTAAGKPVHTAQPHSGDLCL